MAYSYLIVVGKTVANTITTVSRSPISSCFKGMPETAVIFMTVFVFDSSGYNY